MESYMCKDCGERVDAPHRDRYTCPHCSVYDEDSGEV